MAAPETSAHGGFTDWAWSDGWRDVEAMAHVRDVNVRVIRGGRIGLLRRQWHFRLSGDPYHIAVILATKFPWMAESPLKVDAVDPSAADTGKPSTRDS